MNGCSSGPTGRDLHSPSELHGHDFGSGEFNILISTGQQRVGTALSGTSVCPTYALSRLSARLAFNNYPRTGPRCRPNP